MWFHKLALVEHEGVQETSMKFFHTAVRSSHFIKPDTASVRYATSHLRGKKKGRLILYLSYAAYHVNN